MYVIDTITCLLTCTDGAVHTSTALLMNGLRSKKLGSTLKALSAVMYGDSDIQCIKPFSAWHDFSASGANYKEAKAIIGIEFVTPDVQHDDLCVTPLGLRMCIAPSVLVQVRKSWIPPYCCPMQYMNWAMYSKPAHPLFEHVIDLILDAQHAKHCSKSAGKSLTRQELTAVWTTGPVRLTKAVERYLAVGHNGYTDEYGINYPERNDMSLQSITVLQAYSMNNLVNVEL
eukprot:12121-Heterococcus_DN1.PRE.5